MPQLSFFFSTLLSLALVTGGALVSATEQAYRLHTVADQLANPWSVAFLPDGDYLVSLRGGELLRIDADGANRQSLSGVPDTYFAGQGGFFDVALDPDFELNQRIYLSYAHGNPAANQPAVMRATLTVQGLEQQQVILKAEPTRDTPQHYGGRLLFLPDKTLLLATGDGFEYREQAQSLESELGKILRIDRNGLAPADNPFFEQGEKAARIWSYGHRNSQGLAYAGGGRVYQHEHGPRGGDEVNLVSPGKNYGWPVATEGVNYSGAYVSPFTEFPGMEPALIGWSPSIAPSGLAWYEGDLYPGWRNSLFVGALAAHAVHRLSLNPNGTIASEQILFTELDARIRDVRVSPDGHLYIITDGEAGMLIRVDP